LIVGNALLDADDENQHQHPKINPGTRSSRTDHRDLAFSLILLYVCRQPRLYAVQFLYVLVRLCECLWWILTNGTLNVISFLPDVFFFHLIRKTSHNSVELAAHLKLRETAGGVCRHLIVSG
jgi:hypothetical protein